MNVSTYMCCVFLNFAYKPYFDVIDVPPHETFVFSSPVCVYIYIHVPEGGNGDSRSKLYRGNLPWLKHKSTRASLGR